MCNVCVCQPTHLNFVRCVVIHAHSIRAKSFASVRVILQATNECGQAVCCVGFTTGLHFIPVPPACRLRFGWVGDGKNCAELVGIGSNSGAPAGQSSIVHDELLRLPLAYIQLSW